MRADSIRIYSDEDGFHMAVETDDDLYEFVVTDPDELYVAVRTTIGPWRSERAFVKETDRAVAIREDGSLRIEPDEDAYDPTDPKHPRFHSTHVDIWDAREKEGAA